GRARSSEVTSGGGSGGSRTPVGPASAVPVDAVAGSAGLLPAAAGAGPAGASGSAGRSGESAEALAGNGIGSASAGLALRPGAGRTTGLSISGATTVGSGRAGACGSPG